MEVYETIEGPMGVLVKMGLGNPSTRGGCAAALAALAAYAMKWPSGSFRRDGTLKPVKAFSYAPDATNAHFLLVPLTAGVVAYYFT